MPQKSVSHYQTVAHFSPTGWQRFQGRHPFAELLMIVIQVDLYEQYSVTADPFPETSSKASHWVTCDYDQPPSLYQFV